MNIEFELPIKDLLKQFGGGLPDVVDYQYYVNLQQRKIIVNEAICDTILESAVLPLIEMDNVALENLLQLFLIHLVVMYIEDLILLMLLKRLKLHLRFTL